MRRLKAFGRQDDRSSGVSCRVLAVMAALAAALCGPVSSAGAADGLVPAEWSRKGLVALFLFAPPAAGMPEMAAENDPGTLTNAA